MSVKVIFNELISDSKDWFVFTFKFITQNLTTLCMYIYIGYAVIPQDIFNRTFRKVPER